jgi:hypothetical protein
MPMSQANFRSELHTALLRFLWRQWSQLGIAGEIAFPDRWIIDPEALLLMTLRLGRFDPRLFDEVMAWCVRNGRWLSLQRLKNLTHAPITDVLSATWPSDTDRRALAAFAAVMDARGTRARWRPFITKHEAPASAGEPYFLEQDGSPVPLWGTLDPHFIAQGFQRPQVSLRSLTLPVPMDSPCCLIFKLRALFGLSPRAEVSAYLLARGASKTSDIAHTCFYSLPAIRDALGELALAGFAYGPNRGAYRIDDERWLSFLGLARPMPDWIDWPRVFSAILLAINALTAIDRDASSDYLRASRMLSLTEVLQRTLFQSGLPNPFLTPASLDDIARTFPDRLAQLVAFLSDGVN